MLEGQFEFATVLLAAQQTAIIKSIPQIDRTDLRSLSALSTRFWNPMLVSLRAWIAFLSTFMCEYLFIKLPTSICQRRSSQTCKHVRGRNLNQIAPRAQSTLDLRSWVIRWLVVVVIT